MDSMSWLRGEPANLELVSQSDRHGKPLNTVVDKTTGLVRNDPIPSDEELERFYQDAYRVEYKGAALPRKRQALRNFRRAAEFIRTNRDIVLKAQRILDIGAGSGEFLFMVKETGRDGRGIEPNRDYSQFCRDAYGLNVQTAHLKADLFEKGQYDFVRLNHVMEHLNNPVGYLEMIAEWLTPDGVLYVEVPNIESYCALKSKGRMFHYGHIYNFNPWTLRAVAGLAGLVEVPATIARSSGTTGVFLMRGERLLPEAAINPGNGEHVAELIRTHEIQGPSGDYRAKLFAKINARLDEFFSTLGANSFSDIGKRVARTISA